MFSFSQGRTRTLLGLAQVMIVTARPTDHAPKLLHSLHRRGQEAQNLEKDEASRKTWILAGGLMVGIAFLGTMIWVFWRWNLSSIFYRRKQEVHEISGPMMGGGEYTNMKATKKMHTQRNSITKSLSSFNHDDTEKNYNYRTRHNIVTPTPALAKSSFDIRRSSSHRHLIREDLLTPKSQQNSHTFFIDGKDTAYNGKSGNPNERSVVVNVMPVKPAITANSPYSHYVPPPIPDSSTRRYSWMSGKSGKTNRTSMESEPPKFRGINSWVGDQAVRIEGKESRKAKEVSLGEKQKPVVDTTGKSLPPTPPELEPRPGQTTMF